MRRSIGGPGCAGGRRPRGIPGFGAALLEADGFEVIGEAATGVEAIIAAQSLASCGRPADIRLPDLDGFAVAQRLAESAEPPEVVLVSSRYAAVYGRRLALAPIRGFLGKSDQRRAPAAAAVGANPVSAEPDSRPMKTDLTRYFDRSCADDHGVRTTSPVFLVIWMFE
jgi:CheY-like chemotaxis protein